MKQYIIDNLSVLSEERLKEMVDVINRSLIYSKYGIYVDSDDCIQQTSIQVNVQSLDHDELFSNFEKTVLQHFESLDELKLYVHFQDLSNFNFHWVSDSEVEVGGSQGLYFILNTLNFIKTGNYYFEPDYSFFQMVSKYDIRLDSEMVSEPIVELDNVIVKTTSNRNSIIIESLSDSQSNKLKQIISLINQKKGVEKDEH